MEFTTSGAPAATSQMEFNAVGFAGKIRSIGCASPTEGAPPELQLAAMLQKPSAWLPFHTCVAAGEVEVDWKKQMMGNKSKNLVFIQVESNLNSDLWLWNRLKNLPADCLTANSLKGIKADNNFILINPSLRRGRY